MPKTDHCNWMEGRSPRDIIAEQEKDSDLCQIIQWLKNDQVPSEFLKLQLCSPAAKHWWSCNSQLQFKNGILVYEWLDTVPPKLLVMVPKSMKQEVLVNCHNTKVAGHFGQQKTYNKLKSRFMWHGMRQDALIHVRTCEVCNINKKPNRKAKGALGQFHAGSPMERIHIDILGPLRESTKGNKCILVVIDQFTKWVEFYALPNQNAQTVATTLTDNFISRFGCPSMIHSDQGKNLDGNLFRELCSLLEIPKTRTTAYRPCCNGQVERYNRTIIQCIRCFLKGKQRDWDQNLQLLAGAIRSTENRNTGYSPNMLNVWTRSSASCGFANGHLTRSRTYDVGDAVYRIDSATKVGESKKLRSPWQGPYLVIKVISPVLYRIQKRKKALVVHHDKLKPCEDRVLPKWLKYAKHRLSLGVPQENEDLDIMIQDPDIGHDLSVLFPDEIPDNDLTMICSGSSGNYGQITNGSPVQDVDMNNQVMDTPGSIHSPVAEAISSCPFA
ncbi:Hypothetical predicted protein [Mytilus galloprovincialis]|uniref:Integrase catalytic domain-containing protein n=1 Tax=Mytilus galloprovincialis TaxID=29158 RepID=A0A8B6C6W7_MYTGA|nr:Hypothetical predicted protein [Mytilus galloprovincialis]